MRKIIHNLRQKPEETRRHILHFGVLAAGVLLLGLWIMSLGKSLADSDTEVKMKQDLKPFSILKESIIDGYRGN